VEDVIEDGGALVCKDDGVWAVAASEGLLGVADVWPKENLNGGLGSFECGVTVELVGAVFAFVDEPKLNLNDEDAAVCAGLGSSKAAGALELAAGCPKLNLKGELSEVWEVAAELEGAGFDENWNGLCWVLLLRPKGFDALLLRDDCGGWPLVFVKLACGSTADDVDVAPN